MREGVWLAVVAFVCACSGSKSHATPDAPVMSVDGAIVDAPPPPVDLELLAGNLGGPGNGDGTGSGARFNEPIGVAVDGSGNIYVADWINDTLRKVTPAGVVTTLAGSAGAAGSADGTGSAARFFAPAGLAVDSSGNVYVADTYNDTIRKVTPAGVVTTLAGSPGVIGGADGTGSAAHFARPYAVAVDSAGNVYVADTLNNTIRKVTPAGVVTTLAGSGAGSADGTGSAAQFNLPAGVAVDNAGNVYVADENNDTIRKVTPAGVVTTFAGSPGNAGYADGTGAAAQFDHPTGIAVDGSGNVYVTDNTVIREITPAGVVTTIAGSAGVTGSADGVGPAAQFDGLTGVAVDGSGNVYVAEFVNNTLRKVTPAGAVTTVAGSARVTGSADGTGSAARFDYPASVAVDGSGNVYVADAGNDTIRKVTPAGVVTTLAGRAGVRGFLDGTGVGALFDDPCGVAVDGSGNVYVADTLNNAIRKVTHAGVVTTIATISPGYPYPTGLAVDASGNVYVADTNNNTIRTVTPTGVVSTLAGSIGVTGSADGTGSAARFNEPTSVAVDGSGNVYVADNGNSTIRKVTPAGVVTTLAGSAGVTGNADGTGSSAQFSKPYGVAVDSAGNIYVTDTNNDTIRKVTPAGVVTTVAGTAGVEDVILGTQPEFELAATGQRQLAISGTTLVIPDDNAILLLEHAVH